MHFRRPWKMGTPRYRNSVTHLSTPPANATSGRCWLILPASCIISLLPALKDMPNSSAHCSQMVSMCCMSSMVSANRQMSSAKKQSSDDAVVRQSYTRAGAQSFGQRVDKGDEQQGAD